MKSNDPTNSNDSGTSNGGGEGSRKRQQADDDNDEDPPPCTKRRLLDGTLDDVPEAASSTATAALEDSNAVDLSPQKPAHLTTTSAVATESSQQQEPEDRSVEAESFSGETELSAQDQIDGDPRKEKDLAPQHNINAPSASAAESANKNDPSVEVSSHAGDGHSQENLESSTSLNGSRDSNSSTAGSSTSDDPYDKLRWITVQNDGLPESMIKLIGLKSLFAKQLPKMPRAYIARLVLDRRHTSLAIVSDNPGLKDSDEEIIGGICYRAFEKERFAEIAFCAVNASHQVKGYGTKLMNLLKQTGARTGIEFFITYADNYAIGYFKKQGFTKSISMPKGRYQGLIKDYDGGTPMECYVHPSVDYFHVPAMIQQQRAFLLNRIARTARSATTVYPPPLTTTGPAATTATTTPSSSSRAYGAAAKALAVPGVAQAGWTLPDLVSSSNSNNSIGVSATAAAAAAGGGDGGAAQQKQLLKQDLLALVKRVEEQQFAWPFREPVDTTEVPDYLGVIAEPIDLRTIEKRIQNSNHYKSRHMLLADLQLMVDNCKAYNEDGSTYTQCAEALENFVHQLFGPTTTTTTAVQGDSKNTTATTATTTAST